MCDRPKFCGVECDRLFDVAKNRDELHARCLSLVASAASARVKRDRRVVAAARKHFVEVAKEWRKDGMSFEQLLFRIKTTRVEVPE